MKWFQQYLGNSFVVLYQHPINISVLKFSFLTGAWNVCSVQFSHSVASDSLRPHESQHTRPPCPSPTPGVYPSPCPSSRWCHPVISSFVIPFSFCPQSFPALGRIFFSLISNESTLCMRWPKYWNFSFNISPSIEHPGLLSLGWTGWISLQSEGFSRVLSSTTVQKHQFFSTQLSWQTNSHIHTWPVEKP